MEKQGISLKGEFLANEGGVVGMEYTNSNEHI